MYSRKVEMTAQEIEALLASWNVATAPINAREREDPVLFASASEIIASYRTKQVTEHESKASTTLSRPWDHADFLARISSFSIASWFAKPDIISVFECARHGWRNSRPDELHCICCKQHLCFKLDDRLSKAGVLTVAKTFATQLITGHTQLCPWRGNPSPKAFTMLPIATGRQVYEKFMNQLETVVAQMLENGELLKLIRKFKVSNAVMAKILKEGAASQDNSCVLTTATLASKLAARVSPHRDIPGGSEALVTTACLVMCGWQVEDKSVNRFATLRCDICNRQWLASPVITRSDDNKEPQPKRFKTDLAPTVDLLLQHRHFCPWVIGQKSTDVLDHCGIDPKLWEFASLPGWRQCAQSLRFLGNQAEGSIVAEASISARNTTASNPVGALESVWAVLNLL